ncbi:MAG TPA: hypothetical protein ENL03_03710, partial [Phycisphaerae bacterium]|nr:hypothetical protein [Phycisphaerae bacterium]
MKLRSTHFPIVVASVLAAFTAGALAQTSVQPRSSRALSSNVIIPQARSWHIHHHPPHHPPHRPPAVRRAPVQITGVDVLVKVVGQVATTTMDIALYN